jgi:hypothetical protein
MPTDEQCDKDLVEHLILPDDNLSHLGKDAITDGMESLDALLQLGCILAQFRERNHR